MLFVESTAKLMSKRWHVQRAHLVVSAMAHFAEELRGEGFEVTLVTPAAEVSAWTHATLEQAWIASNFTLTRNQLLAG